MMHGHAEALLPMIDEAIRSVALPLSALDLIAVTVGPGSFTGIRIGLAAARGIALAADLPLFGISSFEATAALPAVARARCVVLVALESRRADIYVQLIDPAGGLLREPAAVPPERLPAIIATAIGGRPLAIAGDAAAGARASLGDRPDVIVADDASPLAIGVALAAVKLWRQGRRSSSTRPFYLRPPDVTVAGRPLSRGGS